MSKKVQLKVYIDEEINKKLREIIVMKYRTLEKGLLSREVQEALAYWIRLHTQRHTGPVQLNKLNPHPKAFDVFEQVKDYLRKKYKYLPQQVTFNDLAEAISAVRGSDKRTIRKWLDEFLKWKLVKPIAPQVFELV